MRKLTGLALAFVLALSPLRAADVDPFIPADTEQVAFLDVRQTLDSALVKKHGTKLLEDYLKNDKNLSEAMQALHFDPLKDLKSVLVANSGSTGDKTLVVLRGTFDQESVKKLVEAENKSDMFKVHKEGDLLVYEIKQKDGKSVYAAFADKGTLAVSLTKELTIKAATGKGGKPDKALEAAIKAVEANQSFWLVGHIPDEARKILANQEMVADLAPKLKMAAISVKCAEDAELAVKIITDDEKASVEVEKYLDSLKGIAVFFADTNDEYGPLVRDLFKTYKVKTNKTTTTVSVTLSDKLVEKAMTKLPKK